MNRLNIQKHRQCFTGAKSVSLWTFNCWAEKLVCKFLFPSLCTSIFFSIKHKISPWRRDSETVIHAPKDQELIAWTWKRPFRWNYLTHTACRTKSFFLLILKTMERELRGLGEKSKKGEYGEWEAVLRWYLTIGLFMLLKYTTLQSSNSFS